VSYCQKWPFCDSLWLRFASWWKIGLVVSGLLPGMHRRTRYRCLWRRSNTVFAGLQEQPMAFAGVRIPWLGWRDLVARSESKSWCAVSSQAVMANLTRRSEEMRSTTTGAGASNPAILSRHAPRHATNKASRRNTMCIGKFHLSSIHK